MADENRKHLAKLKRQASEIAGQIHDIVEDTLWTDYERLESLSQECIDACKKVDAYKKENNL